MLLESFGNMLRGILRIPPGTSLRKADGPSTGPTEGTVEHNEYINTMIDITVDDICIGDSPLSINFDSNTPEDVQLKLKAINDEFNSIVKDVAKDLCKVGHSVYDISVSKQNRLIALPHLKEVEFYLTKDKRVVAFSKDGKDNDKKSLTSILIFINFSKENLEVLESKTADKNLAFRIAPEPMQLKNAERTIQGLQTAEDAIARYRIQTSRFVRFANVDIGTAQGDTQKDVIDTISSAFNANSVSLANGTAYTEFDDNIPVLPNRKGLGKVEFVSDYPDANIKDLADVDYWLKKLNLIMRFPATYMDFSTNLDSTAVSMIRGDIRYSKLCKSVQSKITTTLNDYIQASKFKKYSPVVSLTQLPTSEDDDVISAMDQYVDLTQKVESFVQGEIDEPVEIKLHRLQLLQDLFSTSTTSPTLQKWFEDYRSYLTKLEIPESSVEVPEGGGDFEEFDEDNLEDESTEFSPENEVESTDLDSTEDGEFIESSTEL